MKKILFWLCFIPLGIVLFVLSIPAAAYNAFDNAIHKFEEWCFDRKK